MSLTFYLKLMGIEKQKKKGNKRDKLINDRIRASNKFFHFSLFPTRFAADCLIFLSMFR